MVKLKIAARDSTRKIERSRRSGRQSQPGLQESLLQLTNAAQIQHG